ncbi:hypothetical protein [Bradyrhizobium sp. SRS-191]|uniref:hypothetical protein n=1 Tax=Bradyrhizobium sp. SRS-191 TaxID=2962606 RepID=UPI00211EADE5|nr:hypothetical protein [Bradyrhizobium sp. SRS-191]
MATDLPPISYPALLWRQGYIYLANTPTELCAHPRSMFESTLQRTRAREWQLLDSQGRSFDVADWTQTRPLGGVRGFGLRLLGSIFAIPVLTNERELSLSDYKQKLAEAVKSRFRYDSDQTLAMEVISRIDAATSHQEAIDSLPKL